VPAYRQGTGLGKLVSVNEAHLQKYYCSIINGNSTALSYFNESRILKLTFKRACKMLCLVTETASCDVVTGWSPTRILNHKRATLEYDQKESATNIASHLLHLFSLCPQIQEVHKTSKSHPTTRCTVKGQRLVDMHSNGKALRGNTHL
jgi:hypothetical protein